MFIRNDAPDSPANQRWRLWESVALLAFVSCALFSVLKDAFALSSRLTAAAEVKGLEASPWTAGLQVDLNDGQLRGFATVSSSSGPFRVDEKAMDGQGQPQ